MTAVTGSVFAVVVRLRLQVRRAQRVVAWNAVGDEVQRLDAVTDVLLLGGGCARGVPGSRGAAAASGRLAGGEEGAVRGFGVAGATRCSVRSAPWWSCLARTVARLGCAAGRSCGVVAQWRRGFGAADARQRRGVMAGPRCWSGMSGAAGERERGDGGGRGRWCGERRPGFLIGSR